MPGTEEPRQAAEPYVEGVTTGVYGYARVLDTVTSMRLEGPPWALNSHFLSTLRGAESRHRSRSVRYPCSSVVNALAVAGYCGCLRFISSWA